jgi:hypothetical protein
MAMREADAEPSMLNDFGKCKVGCLRVKVALDNMQIRRSLSQEVIRLSVCDVA